MKNIGGFKSEYIDMSNEKLCENYDCCKFKGFCDLVFSVEWFGF